MCGGSWPPLSEARAFWQFDNYWSAQATASGKPLVRINMDETCVCLVQSPLRGVVLRTVGGRGARRPPRFRASRNQQRTNLTYVAFVTDCAALQAQLPQFIIGSRRACFPQRGFDELFNASPTSVFLMQGETSWTTWVHMVTMIRVVAEVCRRVRPDAAFAFVYDTANSHIHEEVFRELHVQRFFPVIVPAKTTWLLQPLDAYVFRRVKEFLRRCFHDRYGCMEGEVTVAWVLQLLYEAIEKIVQGHRWARIFAKVGLGSAQRGVSAYICAHVRQERIEAPPPVQPSAEDVALLLPHNREIPASSFFPPAAPPPAPSAPPLLAISSKAAPAIRDTGSVGPFRRRGAEHPSPADPQPQAASSASSGAAPLVGPAADARPPAWPPTAEMTPPPAAAPKAPPRLLPNVRISGKRSWT